MTIPRSFYWLIGIAALLGGSLYFVTSNGSTVAGRANSSGETISRASSQSSATKSAAQISQEQQSHDLHVSGIQKALKGDYASAIVDYDQALALFPGNAEIYYNRAVAHYSVGSIDRALQDLDRAIKIQPTMAEAYANRGTVLLEMGDATGAITDAKKAAKLFDQQGESGLAVKMREWIKQNSRVADF